MHSRLDDKGFFDLVDLWFELKEKDFTEILLGSFDESIYEELGLVFKSIENKSLDMREKWFIDNSHLYCTAIETEQFEFAKKQFRDLIDFQYCFLKDSSFYSRNLSNFKTIKRIGLYED